ATQGGGSTGPVARAKGRKPFAPDGGRAPLVELEAPARAARGFGAIAGDDRPGSATVLGQQRFFTARAGAGAPAGATGLQLVEATALSAVSARRWHKRQAKHVQARFQARSEQPEPWRQAGEKRFCPSALARRVGGARLIVSRA